MRSSIPCALATIRKWNPLNRHHWVQFDEVWSRTDLAMVSIEETNTGHSYNNRFIGWIWRRENLLDRRPRFGEIFGKSGSTRTAAIRVGNFCDQTYPLILHAEKNQMHVAVRFWTVSAENL